ncbi:MAG: glycosyltransferase [Deltaproteobacteria bacterium]|nr:MAG: glycosyltransferase [Deltaproteobacteria bacterium]
MQHTAGDAEPDVTIVIPVYNEEGILSAALADLFDRLDRSPRLGGLRFEVLLSANGCVDRTVEIAREWGERRPELRLIEGPEPNYGRALRAGIEQARGRYVICEEIDLCDVDFHERALHRLREERYDMVIGSKRLERSLDRRPAYRRAATRAVNTLLWVATGYRGTDTHGLKAFVRERVLPVVSTCRVDRDMFASELVIRAQRSGLRVVEIPVEVIEKRAPSVHLFRRVPRVLRQLGTLAWSIRVGERS